MRRLVLLPLVSLALAPTPRLLRRDRGLITRLHALPPEEPKDPQEAKDSPEAKDAQDVEGEEGPDGKLRHGGDPDEYLRKARRPKSFKDKSLERLNRQALEASQTPSSRQDLEGLAQRRLRRRKLGLRHEEARKGWGNRAYGPEEFGLEDLWRWQRRSNPYFEDGEEGEGDVRTDAYEQAPRPRGDDNYWMPPPEGLAFEPWQLLRRYATGFRDDVDWISLPTNRLMLQDLVLMLLGSLMLIMYVGILNGFVDQTLGRGLGIIPRLSDYPEAVNMFELFHRPPEEINDFFSGMASSMNLLKHLGNINDAAGSAR